jgi:hypothetical protein
MNKLLPLPLACCIAVVILTGAANTDDKDKATAAKEAQKAAFLACAKACGECSVVCKACANHCTQLIANGMKDHVKTQQRCQDCATLCEAAASVAARGGPFADLACTACAEACKRCGDECEKLKSDSEMKRCAEECRKCEKACREMVKVVAQASD